MADAKKKVHPSLRKKRWIELTEDNKTLGKKGKVLQYPVQAAGALIASGKAKSTEDPQAAKPTGDGAKKKAKKPKKEDG